MATPATWRVSRASLCDLYGGRRPAVAQRPSSAGSATALLRSEARTASAGTLAPSLAPDAEFRPGSASANLAASIAAEARAAAAAALLPRSRSAAASQIRNGGDAGEAVAVSAESGLPCGPAWAPTSATWRRALSLSGLVENPHACASAAEEVADVTGDLARSRSAVTQRDDVVLDVTFGGPISQCGNDRRYDVSAGRHTTAPTSLEATGVDVPLATAATFAFGVTEEATGEGANPNGAATELLRRRTKALELKAELSESEAEERRVRQRLLNLEGDVQSKVQWMLQWERRIASACTDGDRSEDAVGPAGLGWSAWRGFAERAAAESHKTQRLLPRTNDLQLQQASHDYVLKAADETTRLQYDAEEELRAALAENTRLAAAVRRARRETSDAVSGGGSERRCVVEMLRQELQAIESDTLAVRAEEVQQCRDAALLSSELVEARRQLDAMPVHQMKRRIRQVGEEHQELEDQAQSLAMAAGLHDEEVAMAQRVIVQELNGELADAQDRLRPLQADASTVHEELTEAQAALESFELAEGRRREATLEMAFLACHADASMPEQQMQARTSAKRCCRHPARVGLGAAGSRKTAPSRHPAVAEEAALSSSGS
eukprot:TRINITY_DN21106_c0_g3_i3.p1 TRINITY_DN21106_c0_g3~~TRINITY_DN21106_c0_g3_i3.p1  ORF type:complete len:607 (-),score=129.53 TRINITY_DN21106_c0_g3_i3:408-2228(-)